MTNLYRARAVHRAARALISPSLWLASLCLVGVAVLSGCGDGQQKELAALQNCSSVIGLEGYRKVDSYSDRASWNVAYVGQPNGEPLKLLSGGAVNVEAVNESPDGPFVIIGKGAVRQATGDCDLFIKRWGMAKGPTVVDVDRETSDKIASGQESLLLLSFVSSSEDG